MIFHHQAWTQQSWDNQFKDLMMENEAVQEAAKDKETEEDTEMHKALNRDL